MEPNGTLKTLSHLHALSSGISVIARHNADISLPVLMFMLGQSVFGASPSVFNSPSSAIDTGNFKHSKGARLFLN